MTEAEPIDPLPLAEPVLARQNRLRLSLVWIVPIIALLVGAVLVVRTLRQTGPEITIEFRSAEGLEAGRTEVRVREVVVGRVTRVTLGPVRQKVRVTVRLDRSVANIAVADTRFWVVRPRIGSAGISGLSTLLSGVYIGVDAGASEEAAEEFEGLDAPPLVLRGEPGRSFVLRADDLGSLDVGAPVYFRRIRAGRVVGFSLDPGGRGITVQIFVESPHEALVTQRTRFWHASGIDLSLNAGGLNVNTQSLTSVIAGGIGFGNPDDAGAAPVATAGQTFRLYAGERLALAPEDGDPLRVRMLFDQSLRGLDAGAPIDLLGLEFGVVRSIELQPPLPGHRLPVMVTADLYPARLGRLREQFKPPRGTTAPRDALLLARLIDQGLRAQVRNGNLLTGRLYVALDFMPRPARARFDPGAETLPCPRCRAPSTTCRRSSPRWWTACRACASTRSAPTCRAR